MNEAVYLPCIYKELVIINVHSRDIVNKMTKRKKQLDAIAILRKRPQNY